MQALLEQNLRAYDRLSPRMRAIMQRVQPNIPDINDLISKYGEDFIISFLQRKGLIENGR